MCVRRGFACENPGIVVVFWFAVSPCRRLNQSVLCGLRLVLFYNSLPVGRKVFAFGRDNFDGL